MSGNEMTTNIFSSVFNSRILSMLQIILTIWLIVCFVWTATVQFKQHYTARAEHASAFKKTCVNDAGRIRHDSWLLGVDVYCSQLDGSEHVFYHPSFLANPHAIFTAYSERLSFGLLELPDNESE